MYNNLREAGHLKTSNLSPRLMSSFCLLHTTLSTECPCVCADSAPPHILAALRHQTECINTRWREGLINSVFPAGNTRSERELCENRGGVLLFFFLTCSNITSTGYPSGFEATCFTRTGEGQDLKNGKKNVAVVFCLCFSVFTLNLSFKTVFSPSTLLGFITNF